MRQSRTASALEAITNVVAGYLIAVGANLTILPAMGYPVSIPDGLAIGVIYAALSFGRSYVLRRIFDERTQHPN